MWRKHRRPLRERQAFRMLAALSAKTQCNWSRLRFHELKMKRISSRIESPEECKIQYLFHYRFIKLLKVRNVSEEEQYYFLS